MLGRGRKEKVKYYRIVHLDVFTNRVYRIILLCLSKLKRINIFWPDMLLADYARSYVVLHQDAADAVHLVM